MKKILKLVSVVTATVGVLYLIGSIFKEDEPDLTVEVFDDASDDDLYGNNEEEFEDHVSLNEDTYEEEYNNIGPYDDIYHGHSYLNIPLKK